MPHHALLLLDSRPYARMHARAHILPSMLFVFARMACGAQRIYIGPYFSHRLNKTTAGCTKCHCSPPRGHPPSRHHSARHPATTPHTIPSPYIRTTPRHQPARYPATITHTILSPSRAMWLLPRRLHTVAMRHNIC
eukprot:1151392-Pelagomonas_calceolata.AAC.12